MSKLKLKGLTSCACLSIALSIPALAVPVDGLWQGTTSQGVSIEFVVANGGTEIISYTSFYIFPCSVGPINTGIGFGPNSPITNDRFTVSLGLSGRTIAPGGNFALNTTGRFTSNTSASGNLAAARASYTGFGEQTESCQVSGITWSASFVTQLSALDVAARRKTEGFTIIER